MKFKLSGCKFFQPESSNILAIKVAYTVHIFCKAAFQFIKMLEILSTVYLQYIEKCSFRESKSKLKFAKGLRQNNSCNLF